MRLFSSIIAGIATFAFSTTASAALILGVTSDVALPATDTPCPAGHSDHGEQVAYDADDAIHAPLPW